MRNSKLLSAVAVLAFSFAATSASAVTHCVSPTSAGGCATTIAGAIGIALPGDTISLAAGIHHVDALPIVVGASLTGLKIIGSSSAIVDTNYRCGASCQSGDTFQINAPSVFMSGFTIRNSPGTAIHVYGTGTGFFANALKITGSGDYGIYFDTGANSATVKGCKIDDTQNPGVYHNGGTDVLVQGNTFLWTDGDAVEVYGDNATIMSNKMSNTYSSGIYLSGNSGIIQRNVVTSIESRGISAWGTNNNISYNTILTSGSYGIYTNGATPVITYNKLSYIGSTGIYATAAGTGANISHNTVTSTESEGIYVDGTSPTVSYNTLTNIDSTAIEVFGAGATINYNKITQAGYWGIHASGSDNGSVSYNTILYTGSTGIYASGDAMNVNYNKVTPTEESYGIYVKDGNNQTVKYNTVNGGDTGIYVNSGDKPTVTNNTVHDTQGVGIEVYCQTYPYDSIISVCTGGSVSFNKVSRSGNSTGIYLIAHQQSSPMAVQSNTVTGSGNSCFYIDNGTGSTAGMEMTTNKATTCGGDSQSDYGFELRGSDHILTSNVATNTSWDGFYVGSKDTTLTTNTSTFSRGHGFGIAGNNVTLTNNKAVSFNGSGFGLYAGYGTTTLNGNTATRIGAVGLCQSATATAMYGVNNFGSSALATDCTRQYGFQ